MKNKFMTKALAVVLSASMALSLSSATALTANAAAAPKLAKKTVSVKAGKKAKNKLKAASYKAGWRITKATVKKTAVAKAKVKKNKKVVVVTGVKKGATKIVLKLKNAKTGAAKKLKFKAKVKVDKPVVIEEPVVETASITAAKQTAFDTVILTFDKEIDATAVSLETVAINGGLGAATSVTIGEDKKTATVVYGYAENTEYTFTVANLGGSQSIKTGSYAVSDIKIADQAVEAGSDQPVVYSLVAGEVDVTKYNNYTDFVVFDFGEGCDSYSADPNKPTIYFADKDKSCEVKVTYNNGTDAEIVKTVKITSTAATATAAEARFADALLKWYLCDDTTTSFSITPEDTADKNVVFYAKNKDGKAVKYDDIEVTTSNENVAGVSWSQQANGKYYTIAIQPAGSAGTAKMTIKTTEYKGTEEVKNEFTFDVVSKEKNNNLYAVNVDTTSVALYNSPYAPKKEIAFKPVNSLGEEVTVDGYDVEVFKGKDDASSMISAKMDGNKLIINALATPAGTYKIDVTCSGESGNNTKEIKKSINVRVTDALAEVISGNAVKVSDTTVKLGAGNTTEALGQIKDKFSATYKIEVGDLKITDVSGSDTSKQVKLAVYVNSKPIDYLTTSGLAGFVGSDGETEEWTLGDNIARRALAATLSTSDSTFYPYQVKYEELNAYIYSGTKYYWGESSNAIYLGQNNKKEYSSKTNFESTNDLHKAALNVGGTYYINTLAGGYTWYGDGSTKNNVAAAGAYNVVVKYGWFNADDAKKYAEASGKAQYSKQLGNTGKFNVSYSLTMPKVEINTSETAEHQLVADVDLVDAEDGSSVSASTVDKKTGYSFGGADPKFSKGDKIYAIKVEDTRGADNKKEPGKLTINFIIEKTVKFTA